MRVSGSRQVKQQVDRITARAKGGDPKAVRMARHVYDRIRCLHELDDVPTEDTMRLRQVRQSHKHPVWRLSHPYDPDVAVRSICWFDTAAAEVVVVLFFGGKAQMVDVFYDSVGTRADQIIDQWIREHQEGGSR